jgi:hypothetical protein
MNEQLEDLRRRARFHAMDEKRIHERIHNCKQLMEEYLEVYDTKFAELIIQECMSVIGEENYDMLTGKANCTKIKRHFGVKS